MATVHGHAVTEILVEDRHAILFRARQGDRTVLLRGPSREYPTSDDIARLRYGAAVAGSLDVPGITRVERVERIPSGLLVVMEDPGGHTLRRIMSERRVEVLEALRIAVEVARTLGDLHQQHVIHRNIEPGNILVDADTGQVRITNFDIASRLTRDNPVVTSASRLEGNLAYISPEQTGRMNRSVDYRTDFYSLGVTLYEMLTGQVPFQAPDPLALVHSHIAVAPAPPHEVRISVPRSVSEVVLKLLAKNAEDRYQSAYGLIADLKTCIRQLEQQGTISEIVPGLHDVSATFRIPQKLYGREHEKLLLVSAFERVSGGASELVLVSGYSGVGKSALVSEIHKPIVKLRGAYSSGKFDQLQNAPYQAFIQAFRELIRELLSESEDEVARLRGRLADALGTAGQVVIDVIPEVRHIIGPQPPVPPLGPMEAQNRFNLVFLGFVRALAREEQPLAIFLDDLQWADSASLALIQLLLGEGGPEHLLLIGAYRDNEVHGAHPLLLALAELRKGRARVSEIALRPLAPGDVMELVADTVDQGQDEPGVKPLAELVSRKTQGNPFFVSQFLTSLHDRKLLDFAPDLGRWQWSLERIRDEGITDNVADLMAEKIKRLPEASQQALKLAACIGSTFDLVTLSVASQRSIRDTAADLWEAVAEGLVLPVGDAYKYVSTVVTLDVWPEEGAVSYQFLHDRVQEAAYALISRESRREVHLRVGRLMLSGTPAHALDAKIFDVLNQLNLAADLIDSPEERRRVAELDLLAGRKAKAATAHASALRYLEVGVGLLPADSWQTDHELTFALYRERAECDYLVGHFEEAEAAFDRLLREAASTAERRELEVLKMTLYMSRGEFDRAIRAGLDGLRLYGVDVDLDGDLMAACAGEASALEARLAGRSTADLVRTPDAADPEQRARTTFMSLVLTGVYTNPALFQLISMKLVNLSLEEGNGPGSALGYVTYAMRVGAALGDWPTAYELGKVSLALSERLDDLHARALVKQYFGAFVCPWGAPLREAFPHLEQAYIGCLETGSVFMAAVSAMQRIILGLQSGEDLPGLHERALKTFEAQRRMKQLDQANIVACHIHAAQMLMRGSIPEGAEDWLRPDHLLEKLAHFPMGTNVCHLVLMQLANVRGEQARALEMAGLAKQGLHLALGIILQVDFALHHSLILLGAPADSRSPGDAQRAARRAEVEENLGKLERWAAGNPRAFRQKHTLLRAELAREDGDDRAAMELYDLAIEQAAEAELPQDQALAGELAARFYLERGRRRIAGTYASDARYAYLRWGATAKAEEVEARFHEVMPRKAEAEVAEAETSGAALDLTAVLRASQALSGEIVLDDLLRKLMSTVLESAGAQRGVLVLKGESEAVVDARKGATGGDVITVSAAPLETLEGVAASIVRYVERTGETVVLGDAAHAGKFQTDAYVNRSHPKSILCMLIVRQKRPVGVLYLENNLVIDAFTPERCRVLELLAAQAAISLENARLYDTLESRVKARTEELRRSNDELSQALARLKETQKQLIMQEKLASLGALTSGIAHEIKNPLNFVNNFAESSVGLAGELLDSLTAERGRLTRDGAAQLEEIAEDLRLNATKIHDHGKRVDSIVRAMLEHSRTGVGERRDVDVNALVKEYVNLAYHGFRSQEPSFDATFETSYDESLGPVRLVPQEIGRVLLNLINNAFHAAQAKRKKVGKHFTPIVKVTTSSLPDAVEIRVRDNGLGIPAEVRDKIFTPFFTTKPTGEGTGLGLSISYEIVVQGNGGALRFESEEGEFTEFIVTLPRQRAEDGAT
ncbi:MAG: AAA family ATPase [Polyangiaceae bacterium]|nr:AAA family ATPase [Polyangiaceae bacterium]